MRDELYWNNMGLKIKIALVVKGYTKSKNILMIGISMKKNGL